MIGSIHVYVPTDTMMMDQIYVNHVITLVYYARVLETQIVWIAIAQLISEVRKI
jgi:hypothetical protein